MADTGTPLSLPLMPPDGDRTPHLTFNNAMVILNRGARVDESLANEVSITGAVTLHPTTPSAYGKMHVITGTSANYTITLFTPVTADLGKIIGFRVSNAGTKVYTLDAAGAETIDGLITLALRKDDVVYLKAVATTGNTWQVVGRKPGISAARVFNSANISVATSGVATALTFDSERRDDGSIHSLASNTDRLVAPIAGWYFCWGNAQFAANATGLRSLAIRLNGIPTVLGVNLHNANSTDSTILSISCLSYLAAEDFTLLTAFQTSGGALNVEAVAGFSPEFAMIWIAP